MRHAPVYLPALLRFAPEAARQDAWGRLQTLNAGGAVLSTACALAVGERLEAHVAVGGADLKLQAKVLFVERDADGHRLAELEWTHPRERRDLARVLVDLLARP